MFRPFSSVRLVFLSILAILIVSCSSASDINTTPSVTPSPINLKTVKSTITVTLPVIPSTRVQDTPTPIRKDLEEPSATILSNTKEPTLAPPAFVSLEPINKSNLLNLKLLIRFEPAGENVKISGRIFSPDGQKVVFVKNNQVEMWNLETLKLIKTYGFQSAYPEGARFPELQWLQFSPDGTLLAGVTDIGPVMWNVLDGTLLWTADWSSVPNWGGAPPYDIITGLAFSPSSSFLVTTSMDSGDIRIWSVKSGRLIKALGRSSQEDVDFSPDGEFIFTMDRKSGNAIIYDTHTWQKKGILPIGNDLTSLTFCDNGSYLWDTADDIGEGPRRIDIFRVNQWVKIGSITNLEPTTNSPLPFSSYPGLNSDCGILAVGVSHINTLESPTKDVAFWDTSTQELLYAFDVDTLSNINLTRFSQDGRLLMVGLRNGTILFYGVKK